ncbi:MAG: hypothetical protein FWF87_06150 [Synergistaceae bacterium]|nr:hypothetical protein [Synergistaceae bacterium]
MDFQPLTHFIKCFAHVFFPVSCPICGNPGEIACKECLDSLCFNRKIKCFACGLDHPCVLHESEAWIYFFARHNDVARRLLLSFKYSNHESLGRAMGESVGNALLRDNEILVSSYDAGSVILVPIPLHRESKRRFNQSRAIAFGISRVLGFKVSESLRWSYDVKTQTERSGKERLELAEDVFSAEKIEGKRVIIIDDVITTGTTIKRALSACARAGAECTGAIVWAKA